MDITKKKSNIKLLVVDDNLDDIKLLKYHLELSSLDFDIRCCDQNSDIYKIIHQFDPNIILVDINLNMVSGFDVCENIRKFGYKNKIIMITGEVRSVDHEMAKISGADHVIPKTFDCDSIINYLSNL